MSTFPQTEYTSERDALNAAIRLWERRLRLLQTVAWFARALIPGLAIGVALGVASRLRPLLTNDEVLLAGLLATAISVAGLLAFVWLRRRAPVESARRFDLIFRMQERVSTAFELLDGQIQASAALSSRQVHDAAAHVRTVDPRAGLPVRASRNEWLAVLMLALVFTGLVMLPNNVTADLTVDPEREAIIERGLEDVRDAIAQVATDPDLDEATRDDLLEALEASLTTLQDEAITAEEALATLGDVEEVIMREVDSLEQQSLEQQEALQNAADILNPPGGADDTPPDGQPGDSPEAQSDPASSIESALERMAEEAAANAEESGSGGDASSSAQSLQQAADSLGDSQQELADSLRQAAEAMQSGDQEAAQQALQQAQEAAQDAGQQQQSAAQNAQSLEEAAEALNQTQEAFEQQSGAPSEQEQEQQGEQGEQASGAGMQDPNQPEGGPGEQTEAQGGQQSQQAGSTEGGQNPQQSEQPNNGNAVGAGSQPGDLTEDTTGAAGEFDQEAQPESQPDEVRDYEAVFAPRRSPGQGDTDIVLEPDTSNAPLQEGDFSENPEGQSTVPYDQVFSDYANTANTALDQGYIPLALRDVVREYFTSLAPRGSAAAADE
ncbi:MAG: hypothetical protein ACOCXZ_02990 [Chloroflexota bacterium]